MAVTEQSFYFSSTSTHFYSSALSSLLPARCFSHYSYHVIYMMSQSFDFSSALARYGHHTELPVMLQLTLTHERDLDYLSISFMTQTVLTPFICANRGSCTEQGWIFPLMRHIWVMIYLHKSKRQNLWPHKSQLLKLRRIDAHFSFVYTRAGLGVGGWGFKGGTSLLFICLATAYDCH